jgi:hypothetical protein
MQAAASGKSSIGIPKSVGQEFVKADRIGKAAAKKPAKKPSRTPGGVG